MRSFEIIFFHFTDHFTCIQITSNLARVVALRPTAGHNISKLSVVIKLYALNEFGPEFILGNVVYNEERNRVAYWIVSNIQPFRHSIVNVQFFNSDFFCYH